MSPLVSGYACTVVLLPSPSTTFQIFEAAVRGLRPVDPPQPIKFPLPDPHDQFSLKPGSLIADRHGITGSAMGGKQAAAAATQISKRGQSEDAMTLRNHSILHKDDRFESGEARKSASEPHRDDPETGCSSDEKSDI